MGRKSRRAAERDRLKAWGRELRYYDLDPIVWWIHFGDVLPSAACCCDCLDFDLQLCLGDSSPICCKMRSQGELQGELRDGLKGTSYGFDFRRDLYRFSQIDL